MVPSYGIWKCQNVGDWQSLDFGTFGPRTLMRLASLDFGTYGTRILDWIYAPARAMGFPVSTTSIIPPHFPLSNHAKQPCTSGGLPKVRGWTILFYALCTHSSSGHLLMMALTRPTFHTRLTHLHIIHCTICFVWQPTQFMSWLIFFVGCLANPWTLGAISYPGIEEPWDPILMLSSLFLSPWEPDLSPGPGRFTNSERILCGSWEPGWNKTLLEIPAPPTKSVIQMDTLDE